MIEFRTLGAISLKDVGGGEMTSLLAQPKRVALLAYLALARPRGFHRRGTLLALLWPEKDEQHARWALNQALRSLREALGHGAVHSRGADEVGLDPQVIYCDAVAFEAACEEQRWETALQLYEGDLLQGLHVSGCAEFERWEEDQRVRLRGLAARAAWVLTDRLEAGGEIVAAAESARRGIELAPHDEKLVRRLIDLLDRAGDRAGALQTYQEYARRLREMLDVEPAPETQTLIRAVRSRTKALAQAADDRPPAGALNRTHSEAVPPPVVSLRGWQLLLRPRAAIAVVVVLVGALSASAWGLLRSARTQWASNQALPEVQRLIDRQEIVEAYRLLRRVERYVVTNPEFQRLWLESTVPVSIRTTPPGARVYIADYRATKDDWFLFGISPIEETRIPTRHLRMRIERAGFQTLELGSVRHLGSQVVEFTLQPETQHPEMIHVSGGRFQVRAPPPVPVEPFWLDRYEVTNLLFKEFLDGGGYREPSYWPHPIVLDERGVPWEQAIAAFVDRTGRPGPSTWELGAYPEGTSDFPVGGVSWYEAAAYCRYAGKRLPTLYHWYSAAGLTQYSDILAFSNLATLPRARAGPAAVGTHRGIGTYGHYDMAGNVREWVVNPVGGRRYILGGAWSDPGHTYYEPDAVSPVDRSPKNGFRCAIYGEELAELLGVEVDLIVRQYQRNIVDDRLFRVYRDLYLYEPTPLNARLESLDENPRQWRRETISFDAPYGTERIIAHLFLPKDANPPYQAVVCFPPGAAFRLSSGDVHTKWFDFFVRTGRAVVYLVVEGAHERYAAPGLSRERVTHWAMDIGRSIDYLKTRDDIDTARLAYYAFGGAGAQHAPIFTAVEPRFKASVLVAGGIHWEESAPEIDPANFAPRATVPVLMVNGKDDYFFPLEAAQLPLFRLFGAPQRDKRHLVVAGGTVPDHWQAVIKEILDWLDHYLGPVK